MSTRTQLIAAVLTAGITALIAAPHADAQTKAKSVPKTAWGDPDIAGVYAEFTTAPLERPADLADREFYASQTEWQKYAEKRLNEVNEDVETIPGTQADVHYNMGTFKLSENEGTTSVNMRTSIVTQPKNGRIPSLTPAAMARRDAAAAVRKGHEFDGPENRSLTERCVVWPSTLPPILPRGYNSNLQIFQSPGYVIIQGEMGDPRMIPTDGRARPKDNLPQWNGTSIGRWEGDTLVVETAGFNRETAWRNSTENLRVTERIRRIDDKSLEYSFTVVDPDTWAEPWSGVYPLTKMDGLLFEYACTEGNYGMANILAGERKAERDAPARKTAAPAR
jgi:hypothetical protein